VFCVPPLTDYTGAGDEFAFDWGTSMAAPHVAGVAVLQLSLDPKLSAAELKRRLLASADARLTRKGRAVLRHSRRRRLTLALAFTPHNGHPLVRRATVRLAR
jgi:serine protease